MKKPPSLTLAEAMTALEAAGSAQTRKTYARHGAQEPMFGVSFADLKALVKRIRVDHALALALWDTGNHDARMLGVKVADPAQMSMEDLGKWAREPNARGCNAYVAYLAAEGPHGRACAEAWLSSTTVTERSSGWALVGALAMLDEGTPDAWFSARLAALEATIHAAPNDEREAMNRALIALGCRSASLRGNATAAGIRIGKVAVDHGDTACKTPDAVASLDKTWAHAEAKGFASPAAQERAREPMRTRC